jgi:hypothetical protein
MKRRIRRMGTASADCNAHFAALLLSAIILASDRLLRTLQFLAEASELPTTRSQPKNNLHPMDGDAAWRLQCRNEL